jgi:dipeptidyl aminopeptidase/acylaminoacyl peptidase
MTPADTKPDLRIEPAHFANADSPPILLIQGQKDQVVLPQNTSSLATEINAAGGQVQVILYPNRGHADLALALAWPFHWLAPVLNDVTTFFYNH